MIEIITDSTSDLSPVLAERLGIRVLPLTVHFGEESFRDGVDLTNAEFYARLREAETLPKTSQINPEVFVEAFQQTLGRGNQVLGIFISSELSGTYQSAVIAKELLGSGDIFVVDSRHVTISMQLMLHEAARLRDEGGTAAEIAQKLTELSGKVRLYAVMNTLKYLKMSGRVSAAAAVVGGVLGICPIIAVENGKVEAVGKVRGRKAGVHWIYQRATEEKIDLSRPMVVAHTDCIEAMEEIEEDFANVVAQTSAVYRSEIGAVVGTHAGPGSAGIAYFVE